MSVHACSKASVEEVPLLKGMKTTLKTGWLGGPAIALYRAGYKLVRTVSGNDQRLLENHLAREQFKKLQIGTGLRPLDGWLNSDFFPKSKQLVHVDATKTFPFKDQTFDFVYCEHMIEHIPYDLGHFMLNEFFRVLKVGGKVRIATPDLAFLISLYRIDKSELQEEYIKQKSEYCKAPFCCDTFVINNFVRDWGHTFIYDEKTLRFSMEKAGFSKITRCDLNASEDATLQNIANESRSSKGFLDLETFTLEGTKQAASSQR